MHQLAARSIMWLKAVKKMSLMSSQFQEFACYWKALQYVSQQIKAWLVKGSGTTFHNILFPDVDILLLPWCHLLRQLVFKHFWNNRHFCFESFFFFFQQILKKSFGHNFLQLHTPIMVLHEVFIMYKVSSHYIFF